MRALLCECCRVAGENGYVCVQLQCAIGVEETFHKPAAEKARASGEEDALAARFGPEIAGVREDQVEVGGGDWRGYSLAPLAAIMPVRDSIARRSMRPGLASGNSSAWHPA